MASRDSWWTEIVRDPSLIIGVRNEYLNVYWKGQALFSIRMHDDSLIATTHAKYLLNPDLSDQISFNVETRQFERAGNALIEHYEVGGNAKTIEASGGAVCKQRKKGVHAIVMANPNVVDVEITVVDGASPSYS